MKWTSERRAETREAYHRYRDWCNDEGHSDDLQAHPVRAAIAEDGE